MDTCARCNAEPVYENSEVCENCMNAMLLGGPSFTFVPDENFFKEIGVASERAQAVLGLKDKEEIR